ncbi:MAG: hypothetical protein ACRDVW_01160 [Acidimicrobiales bacterium]
MSAHRTVVCAAPGCEQLVERRPGARGRPRIYCSASCRPTARPGAAHPITVEVEQDEPTDDGAGNGRTWVVRLRRAEHAVVIGHGLGRFSATALSDELRRLLDPSARQGGDPIE